VTDQGNSETRDYESVFICPADLPESAMDSLLARFQKVVVDAGGKLGTVEKWGRRKLSYAIRRQKEGFYIYWTFSASSQGVKALSDLYQVTDGILRHILVRMDKPVATKAPPAPVQASTVPVENTPL